MHTKEIATAVPSVQETGSIFITNYRSVTYEYDTPAREASNSYVFVSFFL